MSRRPTPMNAGTGLTYRSKSWVGAAFKAGCHKHWVLLMVAIGSVLAQVLTVSMSALFEREARTVTQDVSVPRSLEMRQNPLITEVPITNTLTRSSPAIELLDSLYMDVSKNWLYGAGTQQSFNGSQLPWTSDGWSFVPVDFSAVPSAFMTRASTSNTNVTNNTSVFLFNATVKLPAIRARLDCSTVDEIANISSWIKLRDLSNRTDAFMPEEFIKFNQTGKIELYTLPADIFNGTAMHTTVISSYKSPGCCQNGTATDPQRAVLGYWSPVLPPDDYPSRFEYPYESLGWPLSIISKWIVGRPVVLKDANDMNVVYFKEMPKFQAARCDPVIETAEATAIIDANTGNVHSFEIEGTVTTADVAWADVFTRHDDPNTGINDTYSGFTQNITASFGILFPDALLGSADRKVERGGRGSYEEVTENAFVFRDENNGINMDLMTYSMYTLAEQNPEALLNYTTLAGLADRTFQTFFQHFINSRLSLDKGGYAYQPIRDSSMETLGRPINENGTLIAGQSFPVLNTTRNITVSISHRIRVLYMNTTATYLSSAILIWLLLTTIIILCLQRRYTSFMNRDVQLIADMLVLVAGSDNFLELVAEKGVDLKKNKDIKTMLGWFRDRDGQVRWGVEVVGGRNAADWVDAPKTGFHVPINTSRSMFARWKWW